MLRNWLGVLALLAALPAAAAASPVQEAVHFPSTDTFFTHGAPTELAGVVLKPEGAGPFAAIVLLHGCGGMYTSKGAPMARDLEWAERLVGQGYLTLQVDSFTPRGVKQVCTFKDQPIQPGRERNRDAYGALLYLQSRPDVIADRVAIMGWSHGGGTTLATVNVATHSRPKSGLKADFRAAVAFYPGCMSPSHDPSWATTIPTLILVGEKDNWTPAPDCKVLAEREQKAGHPLEVVIYPDSYHDFDWPNMKVHSKSGVNFSRGGSAMQGTNEAARAAAIQRVTEYFAAKLKP